MSSTSVVSGAACGQTPRPSADVCAQRRARIAAALGPQGALLLPGGSQMTRSADTQFRFRPDSDFYYLTGLAEPEALMVLCPGRAAPFTLFVRRKDELAEVWSGRRVGPKLAESVFRADAAFELGDIDRELPELLDGIHDLHVPFEHAGLMRTVERARSSLWRRTRTGAQPPARLVDARMTLGEDRIVKDAGALASLRRAVDITVAAHCALQRAVRPGMHEFEAEALLEYEFRRRGAAGPGYGSIVGAGTRATVLHYVDNDAVLRDGELLLADAGAEFDLLSADLTRTFPVSGRFTRAQRDLYEIVLAANEAGIAATTVGATTESIHDACVRVLAQGLVDLSLCEGDVDAVIESGAYKRYYMHRTSHWLGLDVHDAGSYARAGRPRPLQPEFVLTVEPGLYIAEHDERAPPELRGAGIRIEDDVRVTEVGPDVLTAAAPKHPDAIEATMAEPG